MLFLGMWKLDSAVIESKHSVERFIKSEELKAYVERDKDGEANVIGSIWLLSRLFRVGS